MLDAIAPVAVVLAATEEQAEALGDLAKALGEPAEDGRVITESATALTVTVQVSWHRKQANFGCSRFGCSPRPPHYIVAKVRHTPLGIQKCLTQSIL